MTQQEVFTKIGGIIKELNEQYAYLENNEGKLNDIEFEFFVANAQFLTHNAEMLRKLNGQNKPAKASVQPTATAPMPPKIEPVAETPATAQKPEEKYFEPLVRQPAPVAKKQDISAIIEKLEKANLRIDRPAPNIDIGADTPGDDYSYTREEPEMIRHELVVDESWADDDDEQADEDAIIEDQEAIPGEKLTGDTEPVVETQKIPEPVVEAQPAPEPEKTPVPVLPPVATPVETVQEPIAAAPQVAPKQREPEVFTINQRLSAQLAGNLATVSKVEPISDLKSAITLNDKLIFVRDLFNGYSLAYNEALEIVNRFNSFEEADEFLKTSYATKNNWSGKPDTRDRFYNLLKRRFA